MSSWASRLLLAAGGLAVTAAAVAAAVAAPAYPGIGRDATPKEVAAWDIDVRPDFRGLPKGSGSVAQGQDVWEARCASCHGIFGEANEVFSPLIGGTTDADIQRGRVARLMDPSFPGRTTLMKVSSVSTLWDYIRRAMPWNAPKSLSVDEVYAVTAYLLSLGNVVPADFVLSDQTIAQAQQRLPNRNGTTTNHGLWPGAGLGNGGRADVQARACMKDCGGEVHVASQLPEHARGSHGNLADQQRLVGPQRGAATAQPVTARVAAPPSPLALAQKYTCTACHGVDQKVVGPAFRDVARKYAERPDVEAYLLGQMKSGSQGNWGTIPMPAQSVPEDDARVIAAWLAAGARP